VDTRGTTWARMAARQRGSAGRCSS
jgi:hypothetical protein